MKDIADMQEPHDLYSHLMEREARHAPTHAGYQPKQTWNTLPVGLPVNPQLDLVAASSHNSTGLPYSTSARRSVHTLCFSGNNIDHRSTNSLQ